MPLAWKSIKAAAAAADGSTLDVGTNRRDGEETLKIEPAAYQLCQLNGMEFA